MPEATAGSAPAPSGAQPGVTVDPYRAYHFKLQFQRGITDAHFTEVSGLGVDVTAIRYREGGAGQVVHAIPGPVAYTEITLRYGLTESRQLWDWLMTAVAGKVERQNVSILLMDSSGAEEVTRWDLTNAWPCRWRGAPLDALSREVAIEGLTLVFETLQRA
jgi:phage tail-like protein